MTDRAVIIAALIIGGAVVATSFQRPRYTLSAADNSVAWRMDTWSGQIDICAAAYLPTGPVVRCGVTVVVPAPPNQPPPQEPQQGEAAPLPGGAPL